MTMLLDLTAARAPRRVSPRVSARTRLYRALRAAAHVHALPDAVARTAERLIDFIPQDAPEPVSPVAVQRLADLRGCDPRTIRAHVARLINIGLCADRRRDGGGRAIVRGPDGAIVMLFGVSFAPLLANADRLEAEAAALDRLAADKARLRGEISRLRRQLRLRLAADTDATHAAAFAALPRRIAHLERPALEALLARVAAILSAFDAAAETPLLDAAERIAATVDTPVDESDRSEDFRRPSYMTTDPTDDPCHPAETGASGQRGARDPHGLDHVTLAMAQTILPADWKADAGPRPDWRALVEAAWTRAPLIGIGQDAWALAAGALGRQGAALLVLLADADAAGRGGRIRNPGGWVRRMAERAEEGPLSLHRNVHGLIARQAAADGGLPQGDPARAGCARRDREGLGLGRPRAAVERKDRPS
jgi:replication initiation protein RepC